MSKDQLKGKATRNKRAVSKAKTKNMRFDNPTKRKQYSKQRIIQLDPDEKVVELFSHLPLYNPPVSISGSIDHDEPIHPAVLRLGLKYYSKIITGSNARCVALFEVMKQVIQDYEFDSATGTRANLARSVQSKCDTVIQFATDSREMCVGMRNAVRAFKQYLSSLRQYDDLEELKNQLITFIDEFIDKSIYSADKLIIQSSIEKINDGDVLLTYGHSSIVRKIFTEAHNGGKKFRVIVVDAGPLFEGKTMLKHLISVGIECTYVLLTGLSYMIHGVKKVFIGAQSMKSNGNCISRVGTAVVAMMANAQQIPVLVACETYKFHQQAQLDAICFNELSNPNEVLAYGDSQSIKNWKKNKNLHVLNVTYDVTPMEYITVVITEVGLLPPTSVAVVLREKEQRMIKPA